MYAPLKKKEIENKIHQRKWNPKERLSFQKTPMRVALPKSKQSYNSQQKYKNINGIDLMPIQRLVDVSLSAWDDTTRVITASGEVSEFQDGTTASQTDSGWIGVDKYQSNFKIVHTSENYKHYTLYDEESSIFKNRFTTPERGHVLGQQNGGDGSDTTNVFAQDGGTNNGAYKSFENKMRKALDQSGDKDIVTFKAILKGDNIDFGQIDDEAESSEDDLM
jgi:hypothetical protein